MPFVKLDCGMLTSTIWDDFDARIVFITALLMAEPREYVEPIPQLDARKIEYTGWTAPPDWYGFVPAAGSGIVRRAGGISMDDGMAALDRLGNIDPESRSPTHEGRRMIRVEGGYLILNYDQYRQRDYTAAERQRRYRERKAALGTARSGVTGVTSRRDITQVEVEGEVEEQKKKKSKSLSAEQLIEGFVVEPKHREWARENAPNVSLDAATEKWRDHFRTNGYKTKTGPVKDAAAAWRFWMTNAQEWGQNQKAPQQQRFHSAPMQSQPLILGPPVTRED